MSRGVFAIILFFGLACGLDAQAVRTNFTATVTAHRTGDGYFFARSDGDGRAWRVSMDGRPGRRFRPGDRVAVEGDLEPRRRHTTRLFSCDVILLGHDTSYRLDPRKTTLDDLVASIRGRASVPDPDWYGELVQVDGRICDIMRKDDSVTFLLSESDSHCFFTMSLESSERLPEKIEIGCVIRLVAPAVYSVAWDGDRIREITSISLIPDSFDDLTVIKTGPFWNERRLHWLTAVLIAVLFGLLGWVWFIWRERVRDGKISDAVRRERLRLSYDLHDDFQQLLASCVFQLAAIRNRWRQGAAGDVLEKGFDGLEQSLDRAQAGLRAALWTMSEEAEGPSRLSALLAYATGRLAHWGDRVHFTFTGNEPVVSRRLAGSILMILQESVGNAIRHGGARSIGVKVQFSPREMTIEVKDDGCGFDATRLDFTSGGHLGLAGVRARIQSHAGELGVKSAPGQGCTISMRIPL